MEATAVTLCLSNQKNRVRGTLVDRRAMKGEYYPVKVMVRRYVHLRDNSVKLDDIISGYYDHRGEGYITDEDMRVALRRAVLLLVLAKCGILASRVGTHLLRAGGAMALKFVGADRQDISLGDGVGIRFCYIFMIGERSI